jgi:hypothetical protein
MLNLSDCTVFFYGFLLCFIDFWLLTQTYFIFYILYLFVNTVVTIVLYLYIVVLLYLDMPV